MAQEILICRQASAAEIFELRCRILRPAATNLDLHFAEDDAGPPICRHFGAFAGSQNVGCLTLLASTWQNQPALQLRGMAVERELQGQGVGTQLLRAAGRALADAAGVPALWWCNARVEAIRFYERNRWRVESDEFMIAPVGMHKKMVRIMP